MKLSQSYIILLFLFICGCSSEQTAAPPLTTDGHWEQELTGVEVHSLESGGGMVLAGTDSGVFRKDIDTPGNEWTDVGLHIDSSRVADFVIWEGGEILAAVRYDDVRANKPPLFRSLSGGEEWNAVDVNVPESLDYFYILFMDGGINNSKSVYGYHGLTMKSNDKGITWQVNNEEGGFKQFLSLSSHHSGNMLTGGLNSIGEPTMMKSEDAGETWENLYYNIQFNTEAALNDAILSPVNSEHILGGFGGITPANVIRKSEDGGQTWKTVLELIQTRTFTHGARHPEIIYASGRHSDGILFFAATADFGESWEWVEFPESPVGVTIHDLVAVESGGQEILYLGTDHGLYSFTFTE